MGLIIGGVSARDLVLDGQSVSLYVGGNPPTKVWPTRETVQITLGYGTQARDQFRAALSARGLDYRTVTEIPFDIELVGGVSLLNMFRDCAALTTVPAMDTSNVTNMETMFYNCSSLTYVPDLDTSQVVHASYMFNGCSALTDGNVRLLGKAANVKTADMIGRSGLTREPWYTADGTPIAPREVTILSDMGGFAQSATGDTDLVSDWPYAMAYGPAVTFAAPVTCNRTVRIIDERSFGVEAKAGTTISAGTMVVPGGYSGGVAYVFTEVW